MWYRNLQIYRLSQTLDLGPDFEATLGNDPAHACSPMEPASVGWAPPIQGGTELAHASNGFVAICLQREEKILPSAGLKNALEQKVAEIQKKEARQIGRKERKQMLEEVVMEALPRALTRIVRTHAYIDPVDGLIFVDASTPSKAEEVLTRLRNAISSLKVQPLVNTLPENVGPTLTQWLKEGAPAGFALGDRCELMVPGADGGVVSCKRQALDSEEVMGRLAAGKVVSKLALVWGERLSCVLDLSLGIRQLKFLDVIQEQAAAIETDSEAGRFDADFSLMTLELREFLRALLLVVGEKSSEE